MNASLLDPAARRAIACALMLLALSGCTTLSDLPAKDAGDAGPASEPAEDYSYQRVVELLLEGRAEAAGHMLRARVEASPGDARAKGLLRQIEASPTEYLGEASFDYEVQPGESLSVLAQRFLGNYRLFYILARYNDIQTPSLLRSGRILRIPSDYGKGSETSAGSLDRETRAREHLAQARPEQALALYRDADTEKLGRDELKLLGSAHQRWIDRALRNGDIDGARRRLDAARTRAPSNDRWSAWIGELDTRLAAETAFQDGLTQWEENPATAARALNRALAIDPDHTRARNTLSALRRNAVPQLHQEAVILYRHQELDQAIALWEQVLTIDPDFEPAQGYRARAQELQRRLEALD